MCEIEIVDEEGGAVLENRTTNRPFKVNVKEGGVQIQVKRMGALGYMSYSAGDVIASDGMYLFEIKDRAGNSKEFNIVLDQVVLYNLLGVKERGEGVYITKDEAVVEVLEMMEYVSENLTKVSNGRYVIQTEGEHEVVLIDKSKNKVSFLVVIDKTLPDIKFIGFDDGKDITNRDVVIEIEDGTLLTVHFKSSVIKTKEKQTIVKDEGEYYYILEDDAGNYIDGKFYIDKSVRYQTNIKVNNFYTTELISVELLEEGNISVLKDGEEFESTSYTSPGRYEFRLSDINGNSVVLSCEKLEPLARGYNLELKENQSIMLFKKDGKEMDCDDLLLKNSGDYMLKVRDDITGRTSDLYLKVDSIVPSIEIIKNQGGSITLGRSNKSNLKYKLYKDGKEIKAARELKEAGNYVLSLEDSLGNAAEYTFTVKRMLKPLDIILISLGILSIAFVVIYVLYKRRRMRIA